MASDDSLSKREIASIRASTSAIKQDSINFVSTSRGHNLHFFEGLKIQCEQGL